MSINLIDLLTEAKEVKIYLEPGQKPPKGKKVQKGPRGGEYFLGTSGEKAMHKAVTKYDSDRAAAKDKPNVKLNKNKTNSMGESAKLPKGMKIGSYLEPYSWESTSVAPPIYRVDKIDDNNGYVYFTKLDSKGKPIKKLKKTYAGVDNGMLTIIRKPRGTK